MRRRIQVARRVRGTQFGFDWLEARSMLAIGFPGDGALDITFMGDQYTDMAQWHADEQRISSHLLSVEPFRSRADQIRIHEIDNAQSLGATRDSLNHRLLTVDDAKAIAIVEASGIKTDFIAVIVNTPEYGGSGGYVTVGYNGLDLGSDAFLHEFGHSFGRLADEYLYGTTAPFDDQVHSLDSTDHSLGNVLAGAPPAAAWAGLVAPDEYFLGASNNNWYRSSLASLMSTVGLADHFNAVSLRALSAKLDYWAGPSADHQAPQVAITGLHDGESVSGVVHVTTSAVDDRAVTDTQLWVDGSLARNSWSSPFTLDWLTGHETLGGHTLQVKAFDASGNVGVSAPITVNLASGADFQIASPSITTGLPVNVLPIDVSMWRNGADHFSATVDGILQPSVMVDRQTGKGNIFLSAPLGVGSHSVTVMASVPNPDEGHLLERYRASTTVTIQSTRTLVVDFLSPAAGATVARKISLAANAAVGQPTLVDYFVDGKRVGRSSQAPYNVTWDSKRVKDGQHTLRLVAVDAAGQQSISDRAITVRNVIDKKPPTVTLTSPRNNAKIKPGVLTIRGKAKDNVAVASVELLIDNRVVASTNASNYVFTPDVSTMARGKHKIRVRAFDTSGKVGWSAGISIVCV